MRKLGPWTGDDDLQAGAGIGGAADDLDDSVFLPFIHFQYMEVVGIGVFLAFDDFADDEIGSAGGIVDSLDFGAGEGEFMGELLGGDALQIDEFG